MPNNAGAAARFSEREYGGVFTHREAAVPVGIAAVLGVNNDPNRVVLVVTNTGTTNITLRRDPAVVSGVGILLLGNGATLTLNVREDADGVALPWYAVSDLAGGSIFVEETVEAFTPTPGE